MRQTTECCYLNEDNDIFVGTGDGGRFRWYSKSIFDNAAEASSHIGGKPDMDPKRVEALCRIAYGESTPEQEGIDHADIYRTLKELRHR